MKQLIDLVREEMEKKNIGGKAVEMDLSGIINPANVHALMLDAQQRQQKARGRLDQDPALAILITLGLQVFKVLEVLPAPPQAKDEATMQFFVEIIEIWENANNRFNDQLQTKP